MSVEEWRARLRAVSERVESGDRDETLEEELRALVDACPVEASPGASDSETSTIVDSDATRRRLAALALLGRLLLDEGRFAEAEASLGAALKLQTDHVGFEHVGTAVIFSNMGRAYVGMTDLASAEPAFRFAAGLFERCCNPDELVALRMDVLRQLGDVRRRMLMLEPARDAYAAAASLGVNAGAPQEQVTGLLRVLAELCVRLDDFEDALEMLRRILVQQQGRPAAQAETLLQIGTLLLAADKPDDARTTLARTLVLAREASLEPLLAEALDMLARTETLCGDTAAALTWLDELESLLVRREGASSLVVADTLARRADLLSFTDPATAARLLERAVSIREETHADRAATVELMCRLVGQLRALGKEAEADAWLGRAEATASSPTPKARCTLLRALRSLHDKRLEEARASLQEALRLTREATSVDRVLQTRILEELGGVCAADGQWAEALRAWEDALHQRTAHPAGDENEQGYLLFLIGRMQIKLQREVAAVRSLRRAGERLARARRPDARLAGTVVWLLARTLVTLHDYADVERLYEEAVALLTQSLGEHDGETVRCREELHQHRRSAAARTTTSVTEAP